MAQWVAQAAVEREGRDVEVASRGISAEEQGNPMDSRAIAALREGGYPVGEHRARQISRADIAAADLVVAAEPRHVTRLQELAPEASHIVLLGDFNPALPKGQPLADPWYGDRAGFDETLADIEAAMPGILAHLQKLTR